MISLRCFILFLALYEILSLKVPLSTRWMVKSLVVGGSEQTRTSSCKTFQLSRIARPQIPTKLYAKLEDKSPSTQEEEKKPSKRPIIHAFPLSDS